MTRLVLAGLICAFLAALCPALRAAADPAYYSKQAAWHETLLRSMEGLARSGLEDGFAPLETETLRGGEPARQISLAVSGARELCLFVTGCPDVKWAVADWADARLARPDGSAVPLNGTKNCAAVLGRLENDLTLRSGLYQKLRLNGRQFERGLNVQANSIVRVPLDGRYERFEAWIGVDDWAGTNGTVRFSVLGARSAARKQLFELLARDFPDGPSRRQIAWEREDRLWEFDWTPGDWRGLATRYAQAARAVPPIRDQALALAGATRDQAGFEQVRERYYQARTFSAALAGLRTFDWTALNLALEDLGETFPQRYPHARFKARLDELHRSAAAALAKFDPAGLAGYQTAARLFTGLEALKREALLANPLLDFERLLVIKRKPIGDPRRSQWEGFGLGEYLGLPRQSSWANGTMPNIDKWDNEIDVLSPVDPNGRLATLYRPPGRRLLTDVDLHWDADKLLFSMPDAANRWQIHELALGDTPGAAGPPAPQARQLTPSHPDVHSYDAFYLPNNKIDFITTAPLQGVPCNAGVIVGMLYQMEPDGRGIRQICFEQDHDYTPSVLNDGRVLYLRWDYTDTPHIWNRLLMSMNPDGTGQMEYYGANSYWPNAIFFARAIPGHPTKIVSIVTGHHEGRVGELVIFDPAQGRHETNGVVQRLPGRGQPVEPKKEDKLTEHSWPKFLHPWPLNEKYFIVACKPEPEALWGIYLVDVFDNRVLLKEEEGFALLEPIPFRPRPRPPVIEDKTQPARKDALVYMEDVYGGPGLRGVPRGTVKALRVFTYHFGYQRLAGIDHRVGADGPWEAKRVLGTVPIESDGSALFHVPARLPLSFQPLDADGQAVALMRSWMTALPGENVSCVGCHDHASRAPLGSERRIALGKKPAEITPWQGPARGFSFAREVQPVLDKYCAGCHDGRSLEAFRNSKFPVRFSPGRASSPSEPPLPASQASPAARRDGSPYLKSEIRLAQSRGRNQSEIRLAADPGPGDPALWATNRALLPLLEGEAAELAGRSAGPQPPGAQSYNPSRIKFPDLRSDQGGYVVYEGGQLDGKFITGASKQELLGRYGAVFEPAYAVLRQYVRVGGLESDLHLLPPMEFHANTCELIQMLRRGHYQVRLDAEAWARLVAWIDLNAPCHGRWGEVTKIPGNQSQRRLELRRWYGGVDENYEEAPEPAPTPAAFVAPPPPPKAEPPPTLAGWPFTAAQAQKLQAAAGPGARTADLGHGVKMDFVRIPAGVFVMGDPAGAPDERPAGGVRLERPFWLGKCEVSNEQFAQFDPAHESRFEHRTSWIFSEEYLGWPLDRPRQPVVRVSWQEAMAFCRWLSRQLGQEATLPTEAQWEWACRAGAATPLSFGGLDTDFAPFANLGDSNLRRLADEGWRPKAPDLVPRESRFNDGALVTIDVGHYAPNAWGLCDMHGNAAEWTRTAYRPYPYREDDGRNSLSAPGERAVRGGSWRDRPPFCRSASRLPYQPWQKVFNVGFRVVIEL